jgi:hypothetical protein
MAGVRGCVGTLAIDTNAPHLVSLIHRRNLVESNAETTERSPPMRDCVQEKKKGPDAGSWPKLVSCTNIMEA